jgi:carbon-monoxide dehydrogenase large subunit
MDGPLAAPNWIGHALPRREDARLLQGRGMFVDDIQPQGCVFLEVLRSPFAVGAIVRLDLSAARAMPGVVAVFTAGSLGLKGDSAVNPLLADAHLAPMEPLARDRIAAAGQPVVAVVATSRVAAEDAVEAIDLDVAEDGRSPEGQTRAHWGTALPAFDDPVTAKVHHSLVAPFAMEPRAALALPNAGGLTVWLSTQTPQRGRDDLCVMLGLPRDALRVIAPDVGGAFGGKASLMPEDVLVAFAARTLGRPVKWCATRSEEFLAASTGRGAMTQAEMAVGPDGVGLGLRADLRFVLGHWMPYSALSPIRNAGRILPGPYAIPFDVTAVAALTEGPAVNIYRGAGRPEAAMLMERLMDRAAARCGLDPLEIRRRNIGPKDGNSSICSGDFSGLLDRLEAETGYATLRAGLAMRRAAGDICGLGLALYVEPCGQGWETAFIELLPSGRVLAGTGSSAQGQGRETAMAQIAAHGLGISPGMIDVVAGDTASVPEGIGALASRSTAIGGSAMWRAAQGLRAKVMEAAAQHLGGPVQAIGPEGFSRGDKTLSWQTLGASPPLRVDIWHEAAAEAWASGAVLAEVVIDTETGALTIERITWVDDAGVVINPMLVQGQLMGGAAQGIGAAMMERMVYANGQLQSGSLMDYALPRATDMPPIRLFSQPTPSPANPLGVKGVGEAGCIGVPAAILNAVMDALPPGTPDLSLPLTPEKLWRAMTGPRP